MMAVLGFVLLASSYGYYTFNNRTQGQYFDSNGTQIHYIVEGSGVPVVLLHGFAVNADLNWRKPGITEVLKSGFKVISPDLRGHGLSGKPHDEAQYGIQMIEDVINLLDHLEIEKAHLVGYSLGGFLALKSAALYPNRWISVTPMASGWEDPETSNGISALDQVAKDLREGKSVGPIIAYFDEDREPGILHTLWVKILTTWFNDREALEKLVIAAPQLGLTAIELQSIHNPLCCIIGSNDPFLRSARSLADNANNIELVVIDGEDHVTTPGKKETQQALVRFLRKHSMAY